MTDQKDALGQSPDQDAIQTLKGELQAARAALRDHEQQLARVNQDLMLYSQSREEMEIRLARVFEASGEFIYETERSGKFTFLSERFEQITGHTPETCLGKRLADLVPADERDDIRQAFLEIGLHGASHRDFEVPISHKDGHIIWINITIAPFQNAEGVFQGFCGSAADITAQIRARAALQESEYLLNLAADMADLGYALWDEDGECFVSVSDSFAAIHGVSVEIYMREYSGHQASLSFLHPEDRSRYTAFETALTIDSKGESIDYRIYRPDGKIRHLREQYQFLHDDRHQKRLSLVVIQDITDLKDTEEKLHDVSDAQEQTESRLARIVDASGGFTYESAPDGKITFISEQFETLTGYSAASMTGQNITTLVVESERAAVQRQIQETAGKPQSERFFEAPIVHKAGHIVWLNVTVAPYHTKDGTLIGYCGQGIDVSSRKEREFELEATREKADAANRAKTDFLTTMSHEIRTPMNGVLGMAQLLARTELNHQQHIYIKSIIESGDLLLTLLNDILDLSKIEEQQLALEEIPFDVSDILTKCTQLWAPRFAQKSLTMTVSNQLPSRTEVCGDPTRLYQILQNLLGNAFKFTAKGEVSLKARLEEDEDNLLSLRFEVADTGIGIDKNGQKVLFDRFAQVDSSIARRYGGSGLGLSICRELVALMGGEIGVISTPGSGSTFWFSVQLAKVASQSPQNARAQDTVSPPALPRLEQSTKILVAEDNVVNQNVITAFLKIAGLQAELASNGVEAVEAARAQKFDLILMDIQMPELDGLAATQQILELSDHYKTVPIIALTANAAKSDQLHYLQSGMTDFIPKPINPADLFDVLEKYVPEADLDSNATDATETAGEGPLARRA